MNTLKSLLIVSTSVITIAIMTILLQPILPSEAYPFQNKLPFKNFKFEAELLYAGDLFPQTMTVLNTPANTRIPVKAVASSKASNLGYIYGLMDLKVISQTTSHIKVDTWDYKTGKAIKGYLPKQQISQVKPRQDWGILVDISSQKAYIYKNRLLSKVVLISSGLAPEETPKGSFMIGDRGGSFYSDKYQEGAWNWVRFYRAYLFHSVPFDRNSKVIPAEEAKLGQKASHGCIRLGLEDSKWLYQNIPAGTPVVVRE